MKSLVIFCFLILTMFLNLNAQTVNDVPLKDIKSEYVQVFGISKLMSNKLTIQLDFGQENKFWSSKDTQVKDAEGKNIELNSMIDALNFMTANGYEFVQAYAFATGNSNVYHYLMRKKKE